MSKAPDAEREPSPYVRLPWPAVAAGLLALLALLLAAGLFANRNLRPQIGLVATPSAAALAATTPDPVAAPDTLQANTPTSQSTSVVLVQVASTTTTVVVTPTSVMPTATSATAVAETPTALPTVEPGLADEVGKAYLTFWHVTSQALLELDDTHLTEVMDGDYLANIENRVDELRREGRAIKTVVVLSYSVILATPDSATVLDDLEDNSVYVRIGTEDPLTEPTADQLRIVYTLRNYAGTWKVVDSVRSD